VESLGDKLRTAREGKGYTYDQVSRDTNIASRYIEALEKEDFDKFPGEPYLLGFMRNYGDYLGLDGAEILSLYRALKIQEQPVPVEQLLRSPPQAPRIIRNILIVLLIIGAVGAGLYFFLTLPRDKAPAVLEIRAPSEYVMDGPVLERRFYRGDSILVSLGENQYKLELADLGEMITISTPGSTPDGTLRLDLSQSVQVDLNMDGLMDLRITLEDFMKNEPAAGALLRFDIENTPVSFEDVIPPRVEAGEAGSPAAGTPGTALNTAPVVFNSASAYPFTLQAAFQGYCMFRWEILAERDRRDRNEQYFQRGDELNIQAQNGIRMWVSNAAAVKLQIIGGGRTAPLEIGGAGEVVVADIRWIRDEDGRFRLVLVRLD
jgi:cytoskeletal protein RodZ